MGNASIANVVTDASNWLGDFSANWWFLGIIFVIAYLDSIIPVVPSETLVIIGGVAAGSGDQNLYAVIIAGAIGAFLGDNTAYLLGAKMSDRIIRLAAKRSKWEARLIWAEHQIRMRGGPLLITARFIPGGRTALTVSSGITRQPHQWFIRWIAIATTIWATYAALLGYFGGRAFEDDHTKAFITAFVTAMAATFLIEAIRHVVSRRAARKAAGGTEVTADAVPSSGAAAADGSAAPAVDAQLTDPVADAPVDAPVDD